MGKFEGWKVHHYASEIRMKDMNANNILLAQDQLNIRFEEFKKEMLFKGYIVYGETFKFGGNYRIGKDGFYVVCRSKCVYVGKKRCLEFGDKLKGIFEKLKPSAKINNTCIICQDKKEFCSQYAVGRICESCLEETGDRCVNRKYQRKVKLEDI